MIWVLFLNISSLILVSVKKKKSKDKTETTPLISHTELVKSTWRQWVVSMDMAQYRLKITKLHSFVCWGRGLDARHRVIDIKFPLEVKSQTSSSQSSPLNYHQRLLTIPSTSDAAGPQSCFLSAEKTEGFKPHTDFPGTSLF